MRFDIASEKSNPFLKRKELLLTIENPKEPTPSKAGLQTLLAKQFGTELERVEVVDIIPDRGRPMSRARIFVWEEKNVQDLSKVVKEKAPSEEAKPKETKKKGE